MRTCTECGQTKGDDEFGKQKAGRDGLRPDCKECARARARRYRQRPGIKEREIHNARVRRYAQLGVTAEQFDAMREAQDFRCGICRIHEDDLPRRLCLDHDAATGLVRGLLCDSCNMGLGYFHDSTVYLRRAVAYVENQSRQEIATGA